MKDNIDKMKDLMRQTGSNKLLNRIDRQDVYLDCRIDDAMNMIERLQEDMDLRKTTEKVILDEIDELKRSKVNRKGEFDPVIKHISAQIVKMQMSAKSSKRGSSQ